MESKKEIDELIPGKYKPVTLFFKANFPVEELLQTIRNAELKYPLIIKPDIGMKGKAVIKVNTDYELLSAASQFTVDYLVQSFIHFPKELGIFYVRFPWEENGKITGIVEKEFLKVRGDGQSTIRQLLFKNPRYILQLPVLSDTLGMDLNIILKNDVEKILVPYGNHVRGSLFLDSSFKNTKQLESVIDNACKAINGFYFGRLDIRFNSFEDLAEDKNWCIVEVNGAGSEPTHVYDPRHSLFFAWREIVRHWKMLYIVSTQNNKKGFSYLLFKEGITMFRQNYKHSKKLNKILFKRIAGNDDFLRTEFNVFD